MRLPATYNGWHCLNLMRADYPSRGARDEAVRFVNSHQSKDGFYRVPGMKNDAVYKRHSLDYTWEYINFHVTNYAMGMVVALGASPPQTLSFISNYDTPDGFERWKNERLWDDPWLEGNSVVNLGSFYDYRNITGRYRDLVRLMDELQDSETGFYGDDCTSTPRARLFAMAGATHVYHLYFREGRLPPAYDRIIDATLGIATGQLEGVTTACLDIDVVDTLAHHSQANYRRGEVEAFLDRKLRALLDFQNDDGGFADELSGTRRFDGWPGGYSEPQGISNCFATWFRIATIGMIEWVLFPESRGHWSFRNTLGMGYFAPPRKDTSE